MKEYLPYCNTERQKEVCLWVEKCGSVVQAARTDGAHPRNFTKLVAKIKQQAASKGFAPDSQLNHPLPDGQRLKGVSALLDADGNVKQQWVKTDREAQREQDILKFLDDCRDVVAGYKPLKRIAAPKKAAKDQLCVLPMGDPHIGMYSWANETGSDFDCDIAEKDLRAAVGHLIEKTPACETCLILNLGDFFHSDNQSNRTARAGNALDVDTRWSRVLQIGITLMIDCVELALKKHKKVIVKNNIGNHDDHTSQVLSICLMQAFKHNPRVEIAAPEAAFFCHTFGKNLIISTHGHMIKPKDMQGVITNYYPVEWGQTEHRYCYLGHYHHEERKEDNGLTVEIFNTLAASDAWHHASGYKSKRNMKALVLDKEFGEVERYTFTINR